MECARAYVAEGQGFYAIDPAKQAIALAPHDWRPLSLIGVAYTQVQRDDDAQAAWSQALALSPDNPAVLSNIPPKSGLSPTGSNRWPGRRSGAERPISSPPSPSATAGAGADDHSWDRLKGAAGG